ncbi:hypothetical protein [Listeria booriae]|uniref:Uncharacterized protein n=1 Tax=Listeria booriae TaxID=1552123 RepID=A0A7X0XTY6_9LIST|nr:hypothetical protein [Listeria booriae]MBC1780504.1 hypothetical protein [Listeria booriae]
MRKKKLWIVLTSVVLVVGTGTGIIYSQQAKAQEESRIEAQKAKEAADMLEKQTAEKETKAKNAVAALYFDDKKVLLADGYTPAKATEAKQLAEALKNKELKESLVSEITKANVLYASIEGTQKATLALFKDADQKALASGVDAAKLAAVKKAIDSVPQNIAKMNLNKAWTVASNLMKVEVAAKQKAEADRAAKEQAVVTTSETKGTPNEQSAPNKSTSSSNNTNESSSNDNGSDNSSTANSSSSSSNYNAQTNKESNSSSSPSKNNNQSSSSSKSSGSTPPKSNSESGNSGKNSSKTKDESNNKAPSGNHNYEPEKEGINGESENQNGGTDISWGW